ncbi:GerAB/ArcD/ProY family transporter [Paenibacillus aestuarii]|uniref:GerAB/ArcD/ProY family transporter n=1 Tax=Paenibacillus aestuarii TaxID=516965 RepID=A0ABW0K611_9BACL|nr:GerAB/ArcD/ProY family transporter [Paenibacillus aestuarii]
MAQFPLYELLELKKLGKPQLKKGVNPLNSRMYAILTIPLFFFGAHSSIAFLLFPRAMLHATAYGHWEPVVLDVLIEFVLTVVLLKGLKKAGNMDYADLFLPLGRWISTVLILVIVCYFLFIAIMGIRGFAELLMIVFVVRSPLYAILLLLSLITLLGSSIGLQGVFRASNLLSIIFLPALFFALLGCFVNSKLFNLFPIVNTSFDFLQHGKFLVPLFSICPFLFLGMLPPVFRVRMKPILITMIALTLLDLAIVYIPILVYGINAARLLNFPLVTSIDSVNITWTVFNRVSLFYAVALLAFVLATASFTIWSSALLVRKMVPAWKESYIRPALCFILFGLAYVIPNWSSIVKIYNIDIWVRLFIYFIIPCAVYVRGGFIQRMNRKKVYKNGA